MHLIAVLVFALLCTSPPLGLLFVTAVPTSVCPSTLCSCDFSSTNEYTIICPPPFQSGIVLPNPTGTIIVSTVAIIIKNSNLTAYPSNLCAYSSTLRSLDLSSNQINTALPATYLSCLTNLQYVYLYNNRIPSVDANAFASNLQLLTIDMSRNYLTSIPSTLFPSTLTKLLTIDLNHNLIQSLDTWFLYLPAIRTIDLNNNRITGLVNSFGFSLVNQNDVSSYLSKVFIFKFKNFFF